ncbi:hypothetical protein HDU97_006210 [Phlyctochytrium planicorne]|nr:hypothetical protein HDU97_006210 [Phlyctochytrium planicorne]
MNPIISIALLAAMSVQAQQLCERVVDNMKTPTTRFYINLLGGEYGVDRGGSHLYVYPGYIEISPGDNSTFITNFDDPDPTLHPNLTIYSNYFYLKFLWDDDFTTCHDLSPFQYVAINMSMSSSVDTYVTLTTKGAGCNTRAKDSVYQKMSKYIKWDGAGHLALIDIKKEFGQTYDGKESYDFGHNMGLALVGMTRGATYKIYSISLIGPCNLVGTTNSTAISSLPSETSGSTTSNGASMATISSLDAGAVASATVTGGSSAASTANGKQSSGKEWRDKAAILPVTKSSASILTSTGLRIQSPLHIDSKATEEAMILSKPQRSKPTSSASPSNYIHLAVTFILLLECSSRVSANLPCPQKVSSFSSITTSNNRIIHYGGSVCDGTNWPTGDSSNLMCEATPSEYDGKPVIVEVKPREPKFVPQPSKSQCCAFDKLTNWMVCSGGEPWFDNRVERFNVLEFQWLEPISAPSSVNFGGRTQHACAVAEGVYYIHGGILKDGTEANDGIFAINLQTLAWSNIALSSDLGSRHGHAMVPYGPTLSSLLILFGTSLIHPEEKPLLPLLYNPTLSTLSIAPISTKDLPRDITAPVSCQTHPPTHGVFCYGGGTHQLVYLNPFNTTWSYLGSPSSSANPGSGTVSFYNSDSIVVVRGVDGTDACSATPFTGYYPIPPLTGIPPTIPPSNIITYPTTPNTPWLIAPPPGGFPPPSGLTPTLPVQSIPQPTPTTGRFLPSDTTPTSSATGGVPPIATGAPPADFGESVSGLSRGAIAGIVAGTLAALLLAAFLAILCCVCCCKGRRKRPFGAAAGAAAAAPVPPGARGLEDGWMKSTSPAGVAPGGYGGPEMVGVGAGAAAVTAGAAAASRRKGYGNERGSYGGSPREWESVEMGSVPPSADGYGYSGSRDYGIPVAAAAGAAAVAGGAVTGGKRGRGSKGYEPVASSSSSPREMASIEPVATPTYSSKNGLYDSPSSSPRELFGSFDSPSRGSLDLPLGVGLAGAAVGAAAVGGAAVAASEGKKKRRSVRGAIYQPVPTPSPRELLEEIPETEPAQEAPYSSPRALASPEPQESALPSIPTPAPSPATIPTSVIAGTAVATGATAAVLASTSTSRSPSRTKYTVSEIPKFRPKSPQYATMATETPPLRTTPTSPLALHPPIPAPISTDLDSDSDEIEMVREGSGETVSPLSPTQSSTGYILAGSTKPAPAPAPAMRGGLNMAPLSEVGVSIAARKERESNRRSLLVGAGAVAAGAAAAGVAATTTTTSRTVTTRTVTGTSTSTSTSSSSRNLSSVPVSTPDFLVSTTSTTITPPERPTSPPYLPSSRPELNATIAHPRLKSPTGERSFGAIPEEEEEEEVVEMVGGQRVVRRRVRRGVVAGGMAEERVVVEEVVGVTRGMGTRVKREVFVVEEVGRGSVEIGSGGYSLSTLNITTFVERCRAVSPAFDMRTFLKSLMDESNDRKDSSDAVVVQRAFKTAGFRGTPAEKGRMVQVLLNESSETATRQWIRFFRQMNGPEAIIGDVEVPARPEVTTRVGTIERSLSENAEKDAGVRDFLDAIEMDGGHFDLREFVYECSSRHSGFDLEEFYEAFAQSGGNDTEAFAAGLKAAGLSTSSDSSDIKRYLTILFGSTSSRSLQSFRFLIRTIGSTHAHSNLFRIADQRQQTETQTRNLMTQLNAFTSTASASKNASVSFTFRRFLKKCGVLEHGWKSDVDFNVGELMARLGALNGSVSFVKLVAVFKACGINTTSSEYRNLIGEVGEGYYDVGLEIFKRLSVFCKGVKVEWGVWTAKILLDDLEANRVTFKEFVETVKSLSSKTDFKYAEFSTRCSSVNMRYGATVFSMHAFVDSLVRSKGEVTFDVIAKSFQESGLRTSSKEYRDLLSALAVDSSFSVTVVQQWVDFMRLWGVEWFLASAETFLKPKVDLSPRQQSYKSAFLHGPSLELSGKPQPVTSPTESTASDRPKRKSWMTQISEMVYDGAETVGDKAKQAGGFITRRVSVNRDEIKK